MENHPQIFVTGHRSPDIDSLASATALAELRRRHSDCTVTALCPGVLNERAKWLFHRFNVKPPMPRGDLYVRIRDIMNCDFPTVIAGTPLLDAVQKLGETGYPRLPVVSNDGKFLGMLSPLTQLSKLLDVGHDSGEGLTGRSIYSSIDLISQVIRAEKLTACDEAKLQEFRVYVAAMSVESFDAHIPSGKEEKLALIVGDRAEIHLHALQRRSRLIIITGERPVEPLILNEAKRVGVSVLRTPLDSASVIRRLKFSEPVEYADFPKNGMILSEEMRLHGLERKLLSAPEDVFPVVDDQNRFAGAVLKGTISGEAPFKIIMVDHNEITQSLPGVEFLPVIEVVDHHRIGMPATSQPIKFTGDVVGSTCTLVAAMFKGSGESLTAEMAGILLGGIVSDTLNLKSPTTSALDRKMVEWLEKLSGTTGTELMEQLCRIGSPLELKPAPEVIESDRKIYTEHGFKFALSQVEESNLNRLHQRKEELVEAMKQSMAEEKLDFCGLMVTDTVRANSEFLFIGSSEIRRELPYSFSEERICELHNVVSRKKQLLPQILNALAALSGR